MPAYKDEERGTWYALFYYTDWTGAKRRKKKRGFERKRDALEWEREFLKTASGSPNMTFASLLAIYNDDMAERLRKSTISSKKWLADTHLIPFFGEIPLNEITPAHVRKWQAGIMSKGYAPTYLKTINNQLTAVLNYAVKFYGLPSNPCHIAGSMGKKHAGDMKFWTTVDFEKFLACVEKVPDRTGFLLLFWTGMRIGELLALTEADFDIERGCVSISKTFQVVEGEAIVSEPKTPKSKRTVPLPASVVLAVKAYLPRLYSYEVNDRLFPYSKNYFHRAMRRGCDSSGVECIRLHDLRHSHASLLIEMGVPILLVSERLGHEDIETTLRTYGHLYPNRHDDTVARLDALIAEHAPGGENGEM
jgi:integrase